jgi:hypothetical protein
MKVMRILSSLCFATLFLSPGQLHGQAGASGTVAQPTKAVDRWTPLRFLLGDWIATEGSGQPGEAVSGGTSFAFDLDHSILVRRNRADYAPRPGEKTGTFHKDLLLVYLRLGETQYRAFYIDNEGHDINYRVQCPKEGVAVFESEAAQPGPRFRLEYQLNTDRTLTITFSIAMPGSEFSVYTKGTARRK